MAEEGVNYRFGDFVLDVDNRLLRRGATRVDLNGRYFDALVLLVRAHGQLVAKDRFFREVWDDVVVSDSALTQCIKDVRKHLGDDASDPRYIETVPRHGYRFVAPVEVVAPEAPARSVEDAPDATTATPSSDAPIARGLPEATWAAVRWGATGTLGGGLAGVLGGLLYGSALAYAPADPGLGTASILVVLLSLNVLVGLVGGLGVSFGMAAAGLLWRRPPRWSIAGAAVGGLLVGAVTKLLGVDAFTLLFGEAPVGITGGLEGAALGGALALGARLGDGPRAATQPWRPAVGGGLAGLVVGVLIPVTGGRLMGGSLELVARSFTGSRLQIDALSRFFGEDHFGLTSQMILGGVEGLLFGACVVGALVLARRTSTPESETPRPETRHHDLSDSGSYPP